MPFENTHDFAMRHGIFNDVQGDIINYYNIPPSQQGKAYPRDCHQFKLTSLGILRLLKHISVHAAHDSCTGSPAAKCSPSTRAAELESISRWIKASSRESSVLWIHGPANAEKSAISQTIAESCTGSADKNLVASFFFSRDTPDCSSSVKFWATITFQMAMLIPRFGKSVQAAVMKKPDIFSKASAVQVKRLIIEPFLDARIQDLQPESHFLVIIDSLEECKEEEQGDLLHSIASIINTHHLPFLFLITSCPNLESQIRNSFCKGPTMHLDLLDPRGILVDLWIESTLSREEEDPGHTITSLVFGNNNRVPPGGSIFDMPSVFLTG